VSAVASGLGAQRARSWSRVPPGAAIWIVLGVLLAAAATLSDAFLQPVYLGNVVRQATPVGIAAIGATVVMILGGVDLSVGAVVSFAAVFAAIQMAGRAENTAPAIVSTLLVCALLGVDLSVGAVFSARWWPSTRRRPSSSRSAPRS